MSIENADILKPETPAKPVKKAAAKKPVKKAAAKKPVKKAAAKKTVADAEVTERLPVNRANKGKQPWYRR